MEAFFSKVTSSNLQFSVMLSQMTLYHIVMQCRTQARAEGQTDADGQGLTHTDIVGDNVKVLREVGDGMPLYKAMVLLSLLSRRRL